jgi:hypothetical protein
MALTNSQNLKGFFIQRRFWKDRLVWLLLGLNLALQVALWPFWQIKIAQSGYPIYSPFAIQFLSDRVQIYLLPMIGLVILILNLILALYSYKQEKLATYFLLAASAFSQILIWVFFAFFIKYSLTGF